MNKSRRLELRKLTKKIISVQNDKSLNSCINILDNILWDEQSYYDNMPENLQYSQRGENSEEAISNMEEALEYLNEALNCEDKYEFMNHIHSTIDCIDNAIL